MTTTGASQTARARVRDELTREIKQAGRRQLAEHGSAALSLRAVAREVGMVSSAVYRYFPSRDELLTALIVDAYQAVGEAAERAEAAVRRRDRLSRWLAIAGAVRSWAVGNRQEYALIFGSPVPGYQAPADTIDPAARIPLLILGLLSESAATGQGVPVDQRPMPRAVRSDLRALRAALSSTTDGASPDGGSLDEPQLAVAVMAWTQLIGSISFELFGHLNNVISDYAGYFDYQMRGVAADLGLVRPARTAGSERPTSRLG